MFAKRQSALAASAGAPPQTFLERVGQTWLRKPQLLIGVASVAFVGLGGVTVALTGDPRAAVPTAQARLEASKPMAYVPSAEDAFGFAGMDAYQDLTDEELLAASQGMGEALITLPDGATISGGSYNAPVRSPSNPLPVAPIVALHQPGPNGPLPRIADDGRVAAQAYARPFRSNGKPIVALVVGGLGLNAVTTKAAIERLPAEVTLSFVPYADGLQQWIDMARSYGHEVMIELPMEPTGYPDNDPGPYTLLSSSDASEVSAKLDWLLSRGVGYFGVSNYLGDRFATAEGPTTALMSNLRQRGLAFVDDGTMSRKGGAFARASADRVIDEEQSSAAIMRQLTALEAMAKTGGAAMGSGFSYPVTVEVAARWSSGLNDRGLQLAPVSAMTRRAGR